MGGKTSKQVIVFRNDLIKGKDAVNKGKIAGQVAHASLGALLSMMDKISNPDGYQYKLSFTKDSVLDEWLNGIFTKVCLVVDDEKALLDLYETIKKEQPDIPCILITDCGKTCFNGVPTNTCMGIGPCWSEDIDKFTGNLKLMR